MQDSPANSLFDYLSPAYLPRLTPFCSRPQFLSARGCLVVLRYDLTSRCPDPACPQPSVCLPATSRYLRPADYPPGSNPATTTTTTTTTSTSTLLVPLLPYEGGLCGSVLFSVPTSPVSSPQRHLVQDPWTLYPLPVDVYSRVV